MPKFTGILSFDVLIEEQDSQDAVDKLSEAVKKAIEAVNGVDQATEVDTDINKEADEDTSVDSDG